MRRLLGVGVLTGVELARAEGSAGGWRPLYETGLFTECVAHLGDPGVAAHRRRLLRWIPPALPAMAWLALFSVLMISDPPNPGEILPLALLLGGVPLTILAAWTAWFAGSFAAVFGRPAARRSHAPRLLPAPVPDYAAEVAELERLRRQPRDPEQLRADLEVVRRLREASADPDRISALDLEERALLAQITER